jgi:hypothetical protein
MHNPLIVATACRHPDNLPRLLQSFNPPRTIDLEWHILVDANTVDQQEWEPKIAELVSVVTKFKVVVTFEHYDDNPGHFAKNILLNRALNRAFLIHSVFYFCILDDDNILYPSFLPVIESYIERFPEKCHVYVCHPYMDEHVNAVQYTVYSKLIGGTRFMRDDAHAEDTFINQIFHMHSKKFKFVYWLIPYLDWRPGAKPSL